MNAPWDMWMFKGDEVRLFREGVEIPHGWMDRPSPFNVPDPTVFDPDGDRTFGGAVPAKRGPGRPRKVPL
jgi:hypothetical protein